MEELLMKGEVKTVFRELFPKFMADRKLTFDYEYIQDPEVNNSGMPTPTFSPHWRSAEQLEDFEEKIKDEIEKQFRIKTTEKMADMIKARIMMNCKDFAKDLKEKKVRFKYKLPPQNSKKKIYNCTPIAKKFLF